MSNYLETIYFTDEYKQSDYPQLLCNHISEKYLLINSSAKGKRLLDIGSGKGNHLVGFSRLGFECFGLDKRDECINILKDFDIRSCDIENESFPYNDNFFDVVFSKSVLEHVRNTDNFLKESFRILKPGGIAIFMTPDWKRQYTHFWDDPTHVKPFTRKGLQQAFTMHDFTEIKCETFYQLPFLWKYKYLTFITHIISLLPDRLKWKDQEENYQRVFIRHSKARMLLLVAKKPGQK